MRTFRSRAVDKVLAKMASRHPHLTTQKGFYVEINCAHECAELVTGRVAGRRVQLRPVTGERPVALKGIDETPSDVPDCRNRTTEAASSNRKSVRARRSRQCRRGAKGSQLTNRATESARTSAVPEPVVGPLMVRKASSKSRDPSRHKPVVRV